MTDTPSKSRDTSASSLQSPGAGSFSSSPVAPVATRDSHARARQNEWNKGGYNGKDSENTKSRSRRVKEEEAEEDGEEEGEEREEDEQEDRRRDHVDDDETGSDSDRAERMAKLKKRQSPVVKPAPRRKQPPPASPMSNDGSETSSQDATDDEMAGRGRREETTNPSSQGADNAPRERNSSMTLPSLSRAAMIHMDRARDNDAVAESRGGQSKRGEEPPASNAYNSSSNRSAGGRGGPAPSEGSWRRERSRSRSRERPDSNAGRWNDANNNQNKANNDDAGSNFSEEGGNGGRGQRDRDEEPPSPGGASGGQDVRIMFHGREVYADDLIGLRVAKTFVGHGRYLGQVVKFDEPTSLYTIVYADGDAEELSIENTIQILIQDEIERADPSVPPMTSSYRSERAPDSPDGGNGTPGSSATPGSVPVAPLHGVVPLPSSGSQSHASSSQGLPAYPPRRSSMAISEREAQFVIGLFESHALPVLLRHGWRVQSNTQGTEQRFIAPPGNFRGAGHVFASALDVVELIAFDNELLTMCFPQSVQQPILSLFPEAAGASSSSRKRPTSATAPESNDPYDSKRVRGGPHDVYGGGAMMRVNGGVSGGPVGPLPGRGGDERLVPPVSYRGDERGERGEREPYNNSRMPTAPLDRFPGATGGPPGRGEPIDNYRRGSGGSGAPNDYRGAPGSVNRPPEAGSAPGSRWTGSQPDSGEYAHHRRSYPPEGQEWHQRDPMGDRGAPAPYMGDRAGHRGEQSYYAGERGIPRGAPHGMRPGGPGGDAPPGYNNRYRDSRGAPPPSSSGHYSPGPESFSSGRYPPTRGEPPAADYRGAPGSAGPPPPGMADRFGGRSIGRGGSGPGSMLPPGPGGSRGFSMMDVDRNASSGPGTSGQYDRHRMERGRSPHGDPAGPGGGHMQSHYGHHQRTASNGSLPNPADDSRP